MEKVTVVTVCYNAETEIEKTMRSVCQQDYPSVEYLVVDGASKDATVQIIRKIQQEYADCKRVEIRVSSEKDQGIYDAMNKAIRKASGNWILFMNAGDTFHSSDVISTVFTNQDYQGIDAVFGDTVRIRGEKQQFVEGKPLEAIRDGFPLPFCHQSIFVRTSQLREMNFDIRYKQAADYHLFARMYLKQAKFVHVPVIVSDYLMGGVSETNTIFHLKEKIRIREELQLERFSAIKVAYLVNRLRLRAVLKRVLPKSIVSKIRRT